MVSQLQREDICTVYLEISLSLSLLYSYLADCIGRSGRGEAFHALQSDFDPQPVELSRGASCLLKTFFEKVCGKVSVCHCSLRAVDKRLKSNYTKVFCTQLQYLTLEVFSILTNNTSRISCLSNYWAKPITSQAIEWGKRKEPVAVDNSVPEG